VVAEIIRDVVVQLKEMLVVMWLPRKGSGGSQGDVGAVRVVDIKNSGGSDGYVVSMIVMW
jgi:hypothetical protein